MDRFEIPPRHCVPRATPTPKSIRKAENDSNCSNFCLYLRSSSGRPAQIRGGLGAIMKIAAAIAVVAGSLASSSGMAADMALKAPGSAGSCDPYANYKCLDAYLGDDFVTRLYRYYA